MFFKLIYNLDPCKHGMNKCNFQTEYCENSADFLRTECRPCLTIVCNSTNSMCVGEGQCSCRIGYGGKHCMKLKGYGVYS